MNFKNLLLALSISAALLSGCAKVGSGINDDGDMDSSSDPLTTSEREKLAGKSCPIQDLRSSGSMMRGEFDIVASSSKLFAFGSYPGSASYCAIRFNFEGRYEMRNPIGGTYFTITGPANTCIPERSVWQKLSGSSASPNYRVILSRIDDLSGAQIQINAYRGLEGTALARQSGMKVLICP